MTTVYIDGRRRQLNPSSAIGKGGEADIYDLRDGTVLKLFKQRDDPDYMGNPDAQQGAVLRLREHQAKLSAFPKGLPAEVVAPIGLAMDKLQAGSIVGYTMPLLRDSEVLLRYGDRQYREQGGIDGNQAVAVFRHLHELVSAVHKARVVIGDFNDLNVLFDSSGQIHLVDADSMQFGGYFCRTFTSRFVDPLLCQPNKLVLARPHQEDSDWYAFSVMLFQSLLFVGPYGGVHRPKAGKRLQHDDRVLTGITVFNPEVLYPKPALPLDRLPDELLEHFQHIYERRERGTFPLDLLGAMRWTSCTNCGAVHARAHCPACAAPGLVKETIVRRGTVTSTRVFRTKGRILLAAYQGGKLRYLYHEDEHFRREGGKSLIHGALDPELRFRLSRELTLLGKRDKLFIFSDKEAPRQLITEEVHHLPMFDANDHFHYWITGGQLVRNGDLGSEFIGNVLSGRTLFWAGNQFGFGFYQAGRLTRAFVFNTRTPGINDRVPIPTVPGQLIDATCVFSDHLAWFMMSVQESGRLINRCYVVNAKGELVAQAVTDVDQEPHSWLGCGIRGRFAGGNSLFASTDEGIVRVEVDSGNLRLAQTFPDTEPFVDATTQLLPGDGGIYAVSTREIVLLKIDNQTT